MFIYMLSGEYYLCLLLTFAFPLLSIFAQHPSLFVF
jgi:hypothetical protein